MRWGSCAGELRRWHFAPHSLHACCLRLRPSRTSHPPHPAPGPTELCAQVLRVCRALSRGLPFRSLAATGGHKLRTQRESLAEGVDVLVATPGRLQELTADGALRLDQCQAVVLDEVDVLLGAPGSGMGRVGETGAVCMLGWELWDCCALAAGLGAWLGAAALGG